MAKEITILPNTIKIDNQIFYGIPDTLSHFIINLQRENEKLKENINKAIKCIKEYTIESYCLPPKVYDVRDLDLNKLLKILENKEG